MLADQTPSDRARRICDLLASDVPEERAVGVRDLGASLALVPEMQSMLLNAILPTIERGDTKPLPPLNLPDTDWVVRYEGHRRLLRAVRRLRGCTLVVRQSGGAGLTFYPVIDGHHPSAYGRPQGYATFAEACAAAEREVLQMPPPADPLSIEAAIDALLE